MMQSMCRLSLPQSLSHTSCFGAYQCIDDSHLPPSLITYHPKTSTGLHLYLHASLRHTPNDKPHVGGRMSAAASSNGGKEEAELTQAVDKFFDLLQVCESEEGGRSTR